MRQGFGNVQRLDTGLRIDPRVVLSSHLLELAQPELEQVIEAELAENPAIERVSDDPEGLSDEHILRTVAPSELLPHSDDREYLRSLPDGEEAVDWVDLAVGTPCLRDHLMAQILPVIPRELQFVGRYVVECLNSKGYLEEPTEEIALAVGASMEEVELVIEALHACEPAGIGARNVAECLLLQLRDANTVEKKLARAMLKSSMEDFLARRTMRLARRYGVMPDVVKQAFAEIEGLNPFPGEAFSVCSSQRGERSQGITPEISLVRTESGWSVEVRGPEPGSLKVSRSYGKRQTELAQDSRADKDEKRHVSHYVQRATNFIDCLEQRRRTMRAIGEYLIREQMGFVTTGQYQFLRSLTRSRLAAEIGVHESTISRATADKFVQIATGEIVPFEAFFKPALRVQKMIEEILSYENPGDPLSDERIAEMLSQKGVCVARRTVNKYRDRTKLLSSRKRRTA